MSLKSGANPSITPTSDSLRRARWATRAQFVALGVTGGAWGVHIPSAKSTYGLSEGSLSLVLLTIAMGAIRGLKDARTTFYVGLLCYWGIGAPMAWGLAMPLGFGAAGVWWGLAIGLACAACGLIAAFEWRTGRHLQPLPVTQRVCLGDED